MNQSYSEDDISTCIWIYRHHGGKNLAVVAQNVEAIFGLKLSKEAIEERYNNLLTSPTTDNDFLATLRSSTIVDENIQQLEERYAYAITEAFSTPSYPFTADENEVLCVLRQFAAPARQSKNFKLRVHEQGRAAEAFINIGEKLGLSMYILQSHIHKLRENIVGEGVWERMQNLDKRAFYDKTTAALKFNWRKRSTV
ncbi:MAG: hypothetical protein M1835_004650 [Candelina submexicana]|nr:MAG: hypothetical protein M1835_004650 [Candelina submexicana]